MSVCNYCNWQQMKKQGYKIATAERRKKLWEEHVGEDVQKLGVVIVDKEGKFACWLMSLPNHCSC
jgi:hypothetical protein